MADDPKPAKSPFSDKTLQIVTRIHEATSPEERSNLFMALAAQFQQDHDLTDAGVDDMYHEYFEDYQRCRLEFQQAALRLGRLALNEVESVHKANHIPLAVQTKTPMTN